MIKEWRFEVGWRLLCLASFFPLLSGFQGVLFVLEEQQQRIHSFLTTEADLPQPLSYEQLLATHLNSSQEGFAMQAVMGVLQLAIAIFAVRRQQRWAWWTLIATTGLLLVHQGCRTFFAYLLGGDPFDLLPWLPLAGNVIALALLF